MKIKATFDSVAYSGEWHEHQRLLLERLEGRADVGKLHVVAPYGSGKRAIGLELLRRMGQPCLILSADSFTRNRWGKVFQTRFLPEEARRDPSAYLSYDLHTPALVTAVTYQALYAAVNKLSVDDGEETADYGNFDIVTLVRESGIRNILIDDAYHIGSERRAALETFFAILGNEIRTVALTSCLPHDLRAEEWNKFTALCGEVADEVCIPELVKCGALCSHRDLIYLNQLTDSEAAAVKGFRKGVDEAVAEAMKLDFMGEINYRVEHLYKKKREYLYNHREAILSVLAVLQDYGHSVNLTVYHKLSGRFSIEKPSIEEVQKAFDFLLESRTFLRGEEQERLSEVFKRHHVMENRTVRLVINDKLRRVLASTPDKLEGVAAIVESEAKVLGEDFRGIVITDAPRSEELARLGGAYRFLQIGMIPILETLRNRCSALPVGCLLEDALLLPDAAACALPEHSAALRSATDVTPIESIGYSLIRFHRGKDRLPAALWLLKNGHVKILLGTAESMYHAEDISCVNVLISAYTAATFADESRVRGRILYATDEYPDRVLHHWHMVTVEPACSAEEESTMRLTARMSAEGLEARSYEYRELRRRFVCYFGPNDGTKDLEAGIDRLNIATSGGKEDPVLEVRNLLSLKQAASRENTARIWKNATAERSIPSAEVFVPKTARVPVFTPFNVIGLGLSVAGHLLGWRFMPVFLMLILIALNDPRMLIAGLVLLLFDIAILVWSVLFILHVGRIWVHSITATQSIRGLCTALHEGLKELKLIGKDSTLVMRKDTERGGFRVYLDNCPIREQMVYQTALTEMLSPIDRSNPRYIFVRGGWFHRLLWRWSYACPSVIARADVSVKTFEKYVSHVLDSSKFQYTRREMGQKFLILGESRSYLGKKDVCCYPGIYLRHTSDPAETAEEEASAETAAEEASAENGTEKASDETATEG